MNRELVAKDLPGVLRKGKMTQPSSKALREYLAQVRSLFGEPGSWQGKPAASNTARFPHRCPKCGLAAYVGLQLVEHEGDGCGS